MRKNNNKYSQKMLFNEGNEEKEEKKTYSKIIGKKILKKYSQLFTCKG